MKKIEGFSNDVSRHQINITDLNKNFQDLRKDCSTGNEYFIAFAEEEIKPDEFKGAFINLQDME